VYENEIKSISHALGTASRLALEARKLEWKAPEGDEDGEYWGRGTEQYENKEGLIDLQNGIVVGCSPIWRDLIGKQLPSTVLIVPTKNYRRRTNAT
jgi:hypothetical protein